MDSINLNRILPNQEKQVVAMASFQPSKFGKYILLDKIATGGMAEVYRAKITSDNGFEKLIVIKKILPNISSNEEIITHFIDEAKLDAMLQHENIIHVYDFGNFEGSYFIAMEYLFGKNLETIFNKSSEVNLPLSLEGVLYIALKICEGLDYAHSLKDLNGQPLNIIHRDINPQNIFITYDGKIKIIDFGIAKASSQNKKTQIGIIKGKAAYMSPEQAEGKPIDHRSDIFAVGIILYEMLTRNRMFEGDTFQILSRVIQADFEAPEKIVPHLPGKVFEIINHALEKETEKRYESCGEMQAEIEECMYSLSSRYNARNMAEYLSTLFDKEYVAEKKEVSEVMKCRAPAISNYVKTEFIDRNHEETSGSDSGDSEAPVKIDKGAFKKINALGKVRSLIFGRKWMLALGLILLLALGIRIFFIDDGPSAQEQLLRKARICLETYRLITPEGDCALYYYNEVLKIEPENQEAKQGFDEIAKRYALIAEKRMKIFNYYSAREYIRLGLSVSPNHQRLLELQEECNKSAPKRVLNSIKSIFK